MVGAGHRFFSCGLPLFLTFFHDFATPEPHFSRKGGRIKTGGSQKGGPHFFMRGPHFEQI